MYTEYLDKSSPQVRHSPLESLRFGFSVGRLVVPLTCNLSADSIGQLATSHEHELLIVRYSLERLDLFKHLSADPSITVINAGRLVYYRWDLRYLEDSSHKPSDYSVEPTSGIQEVVELVNKSFSTYENHYSANPRLKAFSPVSAYQEWAQSAMADPDSRTFVVHTRNQSRPIGFVVAHLTSSNHVAEIILNGVVPDWQRRGAYSSMLKGVAQSLKKDESVSTIVISSKSENHAVVGAWSTLGMEQLFTIETLHVMS